MITLVYFYDKLDGHFDDGLWKLFNKKNIDPFRFSFGTGYQYFEYIPHMIMAGASVIRSEIGDEKGKVEVIEVLIEESDYESFLKEMDEYIIPHPTIYVY